MDSAKLNDWIQIVGIFALVASLIFVGLQIRQTDAIALSQIYQERAIAAKENNLAAAGNPYYLTGMAKLYAGRHEELTAQEAIALEFDFVSDLYIYDNYLVQYELGYMSEDYWVSTIADMKCNLEQPFFREAIQGYQFRPLYQSLIDDLIAEVIEEPPGCWDFEFNYPIAE